MTLQAKWLIPAESTKETWEMPENKRQDRMHKGKGVNQGEDTLRHDAGRGVLLYREHKS